MHTMKSKSEQLFEDYCSSKAIKFEKIGEEAQSRPDYMITINGINIVVEVKQIDPNKDDKEKLAEFQRKGFVVGSSTPGARVRSKITDAGPQIASVAKGRYPGVLVLYSNLSFVLGSPLEPYNVRVGMYGFDTFVFSRPGNFIDSPRLIARKFGPKRKLTPSHNTSISALAVLSESKEDLTLVFYHNEYAAIRLPLEVASFIGEKQFVLSRDEPMEFQTWVDV